jgi:murein L,D-transpeptidase YafK
VRQKRLPRLLVVAVAIVAAIGVLLLTSQTIREITVSHMRTIFPVDRKELRTEYKQVAEAELRQNGLALGQSVLIRVFKEESLLEVWMKRGERFELFKTYPICAWSGGLGPKLKEGDGQSPEGFYFVSKKQLNPASKYFLAFNLGFPNAFDRAQGRTGSALMVHGSCVSIGCYAMTDAGIGEIYAIVEAALDAGQMSIQVQAYPFRMTLSNLSSNAQSRWAPFWENLAEGDALFARTGLPPDVYVCGDRYVFGNPEGQCEMVKAW